MLHGHDVSTYQGEYNWAAVKGSDAFGIAKCTEGTTISDPQFSRNWAQLKINALLRGAYHFGHPSQNAPAQAAYFVKTVKALGLDPYDALILDLETTDGLGPSAAAAWAQVFCSEVQKLCGKNCWIYTTHSFISNGCCGGLYNRPLWIASLTSPGAPGAVGPWPVWTMQQYTWDPVDQNVFSGDTTTWAKLTNAPVPGPVWNLAKFTTTGKETLTEWARSVSNLPSAVLRMTAEHSPNDLFPANTAAWLNSVLDGAVSVTAPLPAGLTLYYMKES